jgi:HSP20 family protein
MSEVKVANEKTVARRAEPAMTPYDPFFEPLFPVRSLFGLNPFAAMREFSRELDRTMGPTEWKAWTPAIDIQRKDGNLEITAELPGLKNEEVKVEMTPDALIIRGERKHEEKEEREGFYKLERNYGKFYRAIPLPEGVKRDAVKAELGEGVLKIHVPVAEVTKNVREVPVVPAAATNK